jgi:hypothetical protein
VDFLGDLLVDWLTIVSSSKNNGFFFRILAGYKKSKSLINLLYNKIFLLTMPLLFNVIGFEVVLPVIFELEDELTSLIRFNPNISGPKVIAWFACSESSPKSSSLLTLNPPFLNESKASADSAIQDI